MRANTLILGLIAATSFACGGEGPAAVLDPAIDEFSVSDADQQELDDAAEDGEGAEGSYEYDEAAGTLVISITTSSFACGPQVGSISATVESVSATELSLRFEGDSSSVLWTRVDQGGEGLVGIWRTADPNLFLILAGDGSAQIFGEQEVCNDERPRNGDNCLQVEASSAPITIDGNLDDWSTVDTESAISDPAGDHDGDDPGGDLLGSRIAFSGGVVSVFTELAAAPSESFQNADAPNGGSYRLTIRGYNGLSIEGSLFYSPDTETWELASFGEGLQAEVGPTGIEWSVDISDSLGEGFESLDFIMVEPRDCSVGSCVSLDSTECAYFDL